MNPAAITLTSPLSLKPYNVPSIRPITYTRSYNQLNLQQRRRSRDGKCRAEFSSDAPVAMAIGACILNSLIFPAAAAEEDSEEAESFIDTADARFAVMAIISFIPYFNWMSWVFAWLDTGKRRYGVYGIVYLAPYLRSKFSISPQESWLPITSIILCIVHIQLEASVKNGHLSGFQLFDKAAKRLSFITRKKNTSRFEQDARKDFHNSTREQHRNDIRDLTSTQRTHEDDEITNKNEEDNRGAKH